MQNVVQIKSLSHSNYINLFSDQKHIRKLKPLLLGSQLPGLINSWLSDLINSQRKLKCTTTAWNKNLLPAMIIIFIRLQCCHFGFSQLKIENLGVL